MGAPRNPQIQLTLAVMWLLAIQDLGGILGDNLGATCSTSHSEEQLFPPNPFLAVAPRFPQLSLTEPRPVHLPHSVCHAGFVAQESRQVDRFAGIILRPRLHLPTVATAPLVGEEAQVAMPGGRELAVGLHRGRTKHTSFTFRS